MKLRRRIPLASSIVALLTFTCGSARSAVDFWVGDVSPNWADLNWSGGNNPPLEGDSLVFGAPGASGPVLNNNLAEFFFLTGITFDPNAGAYLFQGNAITLDGPILNQSLNHQLIEFDIAINQLRTITTTPGGGDVTLDGLISGFGGISKLSTATTGTEFGTLFLSNTQNTYSGETIFGPGIINVASLADYGVASSLGARTTAEENGTVTGISLHFRGGTLQYTGSTAQSTNRQIRILGGGVLPGVNNTIEASGATPDATLSFTHSGPNINLFDTGGHRTLTLAGTNTGRNTFSIRLTDQNAVTGLTTLRKAGFGTWHIVNTDNTFTGETIFAGGVLNVASISDYGVSSSIGARTLAQENATVTGVGLHFLGGTLQYTGATPQSTDRHIRILNGEGGTIDASGSTPEATLRFTRTGPNMNLFDTPGVRTLTLTGSNSGDNTFSILLANQAGSATGLRKSGSGTWVLDGPDTNSATGTTTVTGGILALGKANATAVSGPLVIGVFTERSIVQLRGAGGNQIADGSTVTFAGADETAAILRMNNRDETVAGLISFGDSGIVENEAGAAGMATLTLNVPASMFHSYGGHLRDGDGAGVDGTLALTKAGPGAQQLLGTATHTGPTNVSGGALTVDGVFGPGSTITVANATLNGFGTVASPINVNNGGILNNSGILSGAITLGNGGVMRGESTGGSVTALNGSRISPGGASFPGTLTLGTLTLQSGSQLDFEFGGLSDLVVVSTAGGLTLNGGAFNLLGPGGTAPLADNGTYVLLDYAGSFSGALGNLSVANSQIGKFYSINNDTVNTRITITVADTTVTEWSGAAGDGLWTTAGNWTDGTPNGPGAVARFAGAETSPATIALNGPKVAGGILFNNSNSHTISGGAGDTLTLNNGVAAATITVAAGSHTVSAPIVLVTSANASTAPGTTLNLTGNISGSETLIASGGGTTILTGANSFDGTAVNGGTLQVGANGAEGSLGAGDVNVAAGASLVFHRSDDFTVANNIFGAAGQVTKLGAGMLTISGDNAFATEDQGRLHLTEGRVRLGGANALGSGALVSFNGGSLDLNGHGITLGELAGGAGVITDNGAAAGSTVLTIDQAAASTFGGSIENGASRALALVKAGTGALTLSGSNNFTGGVRVTGGTIIAAGEGGSVPLPSNVTLGNGTNDVNVIAGAAGQQFGADTVVHFDNAARNAKLNLRGTTQTVAGLTSSPDPSFSLSIIQNDENSMPGFNGAPGPATLIIDATADHSFAGLIRNAEGGGMHLVKEGPATQVIRNILVGASAFNSATVNEGKLVFHYSPNANNTHTMAAGTSLVVNAGGTLAFDGNWAVPATIAGIAGEGRVLKQGTGSVRINSANSFTGGIVLDAGTLEIGNNAALGSPTGVITINGGVIRAAGEAREVPNPVVVNNSFTLGRLTHLNGGLTLMADATISASNFDGVANNPSNLGPIGGNFRVSFAEGTPGIGTGALVVNGENTNSGGTAVLSGRVNVSTFGTLANAPLIVDGGELNLNNFAQNVTSLSGAGGAVNLSFGHTLEIDQAADTSFFGLIGGGGNMVKRGAGSLTLGGQSTSYFGFVDVAAGALFVNGSISGSVAVDGASSVFGGSGNVGSIVAQNGGTVAPGPAGAAGPGVLTSISGLSLDATTTLKLELDSPAPGTGHDQLSVSGFIELGNSTLSLSGNYAGLDDLFFILVNNSGAPVTGQFAGIPQGGLVISSSGQMFRLSYEANVFANSFTGGFDIALVAIPEPNALGLLAGSMGLMLGLRRRRA